MAANAAFEGIAKPDQKVRIGQTAGFHRRPYPWGTYRPRFLEASCFSASKASSQ